MNRATRGNTLVQRGLFALALIVGAPLGWVQAAPFEKALPDDCIVYANVANMKQLRANFRETSVFKLFADPAMRPVTEAIGAEIAKFAALAQDKAGINVHELLDVPSGQVTFAVRLAPDPQQEPFVYIAVDCAGKEDAVKGLLQKLYAALEQEGQTKRQVEEVTAFSHGNPEDRKQPSFVLAGSVLAVGNDPKAIGDFAKGLSAGARNSFAENERLQAFRERANGAGDVEIFVDLNKIISIAVEKAGPQAAGGVTLLGLNSFQSAGISFSLNKSDFDQLMQILVTNRGQTPLLNLFSMPAKAMQPEAWVPGSIPSYFSFNWDLDLFYDTLTGLINAVNPGVMAQVEAGLAGPDPNNPLLNLKNDLIKPLGNRISIVGDITESRGMPANRAIIAWQLDDGEKLRGKIDQLVAMGGGALPLQKKSIKGDTVYTFPLGDLLAQNMPPDAPLPLGTVGLVVTKTHLFFATHVELLDRVLEGDGKESLSETQAFKQVAAKFPSKSSMISYTNGAESAKASWQMFKSGQLVKTMSQQLEQNPEAKQILGGVLNALDGKNFPRFEDVQKHFTDTGSYGVMDDKGLHIVLFSLKK